MNNRIQLLISLLWLLALAVVLTLFGAWLLFPFEIYWLDLTSQVQLTVQEVLVNFNQLMIYLLNPFVNPLQMSDFPVSASGAKHFVDVKQLFGLAQGLCLLLLWPAGRFLLSGLKQRTLWRCRQLFLGLMLLPALIGGLGLMMGFDQFFTLFHTVLFPGDSSWLFNPVTDPVILILPAQFFLHCFILFFLIYELLLASLTMFSYRQYAYLLSNRTKGAKQPD